MSGISRSSSSGGLFSSRSSSRQSGGSLFSSRARSNSGSSGGTRSGSLFSSRAGSNTGTSGGTRSGSLFSSRSRSNSGSSGGTRSGSLFSSRSGSNTGTGSGTRSSSLFSSRSGSNTNTGTRSSSLFSSRNTSTTNYNNNAAQENEQQRTIDPSEQIGNIVDAYNVESERCQFKFVFYNNLSQGQQIQVPKPQNVNETFWALAIQNNPDPLRFIPVLVVGFEDLKNRMEKQKSLLKEQMKSLQRILQVIENLEHHHELKTKKRLEQYKRKQIVLAQKLLNVLWKLEVIKAKEIEFQMDEEIFRKKIESIFNEINQPNKYRKKLDTLVGRIHVAEDLLITNFERQNQKQVEISEESKQNIFKLLKQQQDGLEHITKILETDSRTVQTVSEKMKNLDSEDLDQKF
ncbi:nucleoporin p54 [Anaeramoeba flamelloides]|uniref:Nucleoporin p54 n=1 Tax=Anaeramoeba flamelloides TaxID=1746091 RepID=A0ABQ8X3F6_9EUKA|nr:nucleoporin p54 [Anaeramoeba flamelloides]